MRTHRDTILAAVSGIIAIGALVVAVIALHKDQTDQTRIHTLQTQLRAAAPTLSEASNGVAAEQAKLKTAVAQITSVEGKLTRLTPQLAAIESCLPELQSELGGLEIKGETYRASYISNPSHISVACTKVLYSSGR